MAPSPSSFFFFFRRKKERNPYFNPLEKINKEERLWARCGWCGKERISEVLISARNSWGHSWRMLFLKK